MQNPSDNYIKIGQAAKVLGVSIDTLRRWEKAGKISSIKTPGGTRLFYLPNLLKFHKHPAKGRTQIPISQAADKLGVSIKTLRRWDKEGKFPAQRSSTGERSYSVKDVKRLTPLSFNPQQQNQLLLESLAQNLSQPETPATVPSWIAKSILTAGAITFILTAVLTVGYLKFPETTKKIALASAASASTAQKGEVLGAASDTLGLLQAVGSKILSPFNFLSQKAIQVTSPQTAQDLGFPDVAQVVNVQTDRINEISRRLVEAEEEILLRQLADQDDKKNAQVSLQALSSNLSDTSSPNLLPNSSFEANNNGLPNRWIYLGNSTSANTFLTNELARSGYNSLKFVGGTSNLGILNPDTVTGESRPYHLAFYLKAYQSSAFDLQISFWDPVSKQRTGTTTKQLTSSDLTNLQNGWQLLEFDMNSPGPGQGENWFPVIEFPNLSSGVVYLDDVSVTEVGASGFAQVRPYGASSAIGDGSVWVTAGGDIYPYLTKTGSIGTTGSRFQSLYLSNSSIDKEGNANFAGKMTISDAATFNGTVNLSGSVGTNLNPLSDSFYNLGSSSTRWNKLWGKDGDFSGSVTIAQSLTVQGTTLSTGGDLSTTGNLTVDSNTTLGNATSDTLTISGTTTINLPDNTSPALDIQQGTDNYINISTSDTTTSVTIDLPVAGSSTTTGNLFTANTTKTINLGTGTAADTINIGTGITTADTIAIGTGAVANSITIGTTTASSSLALNDDNWNITGAGAANFVSLGATTAGTGAFTTLTSSGNTTLGTGASGAHTYSTGAGSTTTLGNSTGALTLASGGTSAWTNTSGNLTISTATSGDLSLNSAGTLYLGIGGSNELTLTATALSPSTSDGNALGTTALMWSDLFLASGGVVNFNNGDVTLTHSTDTLAFAGASSGYSFDADTTITGDLAVNGATSADITTTTTTATIFNATATTLSLGGAATTLLDLGNGSGNYTAINLGSGSGTHTINMAGTGATGADTINIGTGGTGADTITIGNNASTSSLALTSGTGSQTFTSNVATGATTTSGFVFDATAITSGTGLYLTTDAVTTGRLLDIATTGNTWTGNGTTNGLVNLASSSTAGTGSSSSILLNLARSGANANATHTAYGLYSAVTNTGTTSTNIGGYFTASGATTNWAAQFGGNIQMSTGSDILAQGAGTDVGSSGTRFATGWFDTVDATNLAGTVTGGSTTSSSWTINSDNNTLDTEDASLAFERGDTTPNAVILWDSTNDELDFNSSINLTGTTSLTTQPLLVLATSAAHTTGDIFDLTATYTPTAGGTQSAMDINITNSPSTNANTLRVFDIGLTDAGSLANTVYGLYVDVSTANASDTTYAATFLNGNVGIGDSSPTEGNLVIAGSADGTDALYITAGDILVNDGDLDLSGGDFNVTLDGGDTANISKTGANAGDVANIAGTSVNAINGLTIAVTSTADTGADANTGLNITWTESTDADTFTAVNIGNTTTTNSATTALSIGTGWDSDINATTSLEIGIGGTNELTLDATSLSPSTSDGNALGTTALMWSDLFLASGGVINFNNGDVTLTHSTDTLTLGGATTLTATDVTAFNCTDCIDFDDLDNTLDIDETTTINTTATTTNPLSYLADSISTGTALIISADALSTGTAVDVSSTSTAGGASGTSKLLNLARSGANAQLAHTAYGIYSAVTNTNATSGTNVAGYFSASGATTANYGLIVENGNVGIGDATPSAPLEIGNGTDSIQFSSVGDITFVDADGAATITGPAGGALTVAAGAAQALTLTANNASTWSTSNGLLTITGDDGVTINATSNAGITGNIPDNLADALDIQQGTDNYLNISTSDTTTSVTLDLPVAGSSTTTGNLFTANTTKTINLGTGTAGDTINIGTGATNADAITLGNTGVATTFDINSGAATVNAIDITTDSISSGTALTLSVDALTTGKGLDITSTSNAIDSGVLLNVAQSATAATDTTLSADTANISFSPTYSTAVTTPAISGQVLDISRSVTTNSLFASTLTVSGALVSISDTSTQTTGTLTHTGNVLVVDQNYSTSSGDVLHVENAGTGDAIEIAGAGTRSINSTSGDLSISTTTSGTLTLNASGGDAAGEDLIITAQNVQLTATGAMTFSPDAAVTTAITITDTDYTNSLNIGDNNIIGTTANIDLTYFDVAGATGAVTIDPQTTGTYLDFTLETAWTSGTLVNADFGGATTQGAATITGMSLNLNTNLTTPAAGQNITGYDLQLPVASTTSNDTVYTGFNLGTTGAITNATAGSFAWRGANIQLPNITQSAGGTITASGVLVSNGTITTGGTENMLSASMTAVGAGTLNGLLITPPATTTAGGTINAIKIDNITTSNGTDTALTIGTTWDTDINFADSTPILSFANAGTLTFNDGTNAMLALKDQGTYSFVNVSAGKTDTGDPASCSVGDIYFNDFDNAYKGCTDTNTWASFGGGGTTWNTIGDPTGNGAIAMAETVQTLDWNTAATAAAFDGLTITFTNDATTDASTQRAFVIANLNDSLTTGTLETMQHIDNRDINETVTNGLLIEQTGAGTLTNAIQIAETAGTITDGILITGTLGNILNSGSIDISGAGAITGATGITSSGTINFSGLTASQAVFTDASKNLVSNAITGTGNVVMSASPTLTGTITAAALTASGTITANGTLTANGVVNLGDNGDNVVINSNTWDVTGAGVASGLTGITSSGTITFSGLVSCNTIDTNSSGVLACGTDAGASVQTFTANGTYTKPSGAILVVVQAIGAGGGGGGGAGAAAGTRRNGGGGGGGGHFERGIFNAASVGSTETVSIGTAGTAGTAGSSSNGGTGGNGGDTTFGSSWFTALGGKGGTGGSQGGDCCIGNGTPGGGGGGTNDGGATSGASVTGSAGASGGSGGPGGGGSADFGGGGGGGGGGAGGDGVAGGSSRWGGAGGGGGGGLNSSNTETAGGAGGSGNSYSSGGGGTAGTTNGGAGGAGSAGTLRGGSGGGGGGAQDSGTGGAGGASGVPGGGGGGGGGGTNTGGSGAAGGRGEMIVWTVTGGTGADLAEVYYSLDMSLEAADVVVADPDLPGIGFKKSDKAYDGKVLGIMTTKPGLVLGDEEAPDLQGKTAKPVMLALAGRVPTKVSSENGPIEVGDYLTSSSTPGVAMKATRPGPTVGKALEAFSCNTSGVGSDSPEVNCQGKIMTFVNVSWADPGDFLSSLSVDDQGNLIMPSVKADKLVLNYNFNVTPPAQDSVLAYESATSINGGISFGIDVARSLQNLEAKVATQSGALADLQTTIATQSATTKSLADQIASLSAQLAKNTPEVKKCDYTSGVECLDLTPPDTLLATGSATLANLKVTSEATFSGKLTAYDAEIQNSFKSLGHTTLGNTLVAGDFTVDGTLAITGNSINSYWSDETNLTNLTNGILYIQNSPLASLVDIFNGKVTINKEGILTAQTVSAKEYQAVAGASVGTGKIPAGTKSVDIATPLIKLNSRVLVTATNLTDQSLSVLSKTANQSFTVSVPLTTASDINFDWFIINESQ